MIVGHSFYLSGSGRTQPSVGGYPLATVGVLIFFSISGYLISASWRRAPQFRQYFAARALRIFPALLVVVLVTTFVIGTSASTQPIGEYLVRRETWTYLGNGVLRFQQGLPGVWTDLPDRAANGSLWTLPIEFFCYLLVPAVLVMRGRWRYSSVVLLAGTALFITFTPSVGDRNVWNTSVSETATMGLFFLGGALLQVLHARGHQFKFHLAVPLLVAHLVAVAVFPGFQWHFGWLTLPYVVLWAGLSSTRGLRTVGRRGDLSYGMYLWGWPVQQCVVNVFGTLPLLLNLVLVLVIAGLLAGGSWRFIEAPALAFKGRFGLAGKPRVSTEPVERWS